MKMRAYWCDKRFFDSKKFPYGFSRSGVFTLAESEILESKGCLFQALMDEKVFDPTADDLAFVLAIRAGDFRLNNDTLIWSKYIFHQRRLISISGGWIRAELDSETDSDFRPENQIKNFDAEVQEIATLQVEALEVEALEVEALEVEALEGVNTSANDWGFDDDDGGDDKFLQAS